MAFADTLLAQLQARRVFLQRRQDELIAKRITDVARLQAQIDACDQLIAGWSTATMAASVGLFPQIGIQLTLD